MFDNNPTSNKQLRFQLVIPRYLKAKVLKASEAKGMSMGAYIKEAILLHLEREVKS